MITPDKIVSEVVKVLKANKAAIGITDAVELSEDKSNALQPPYAGVYEDFEEDANTESGDNILLGIPAEIKVAFFSSKKQTAAQSLAECFAMMKAALPFIKTVYTVDGEEADLRLRKRPQDILGKKANQAVTQLNMYYDQGNMP